MKDANECWLAIDVSEAEGSMDLRQARIWSIVVLLDTYFPTPNLTEPFKGKFCILP